MKKFNKKISLIISLIVIIIFTVYFCMIVYATDNDNLMYDNSDFIETEQPELNEETKQLIAQYQNNPTEENYIALREMVITNYNAVLVKKEAKLEELRI